MQTQNPFSPDFGTPPEFFGRERYLEIMRSALRAGSRSNRALLIEGVRGTGKTALLGRLRALAGEMGWEAVYVTSTNAAKELAFDITRLGAHPHVSSAGLTVAGFGASVGLEKSTPALSSLRQVVLDHLGTSKKGLLILIDEMQKIDKDDAQEICDALNAARESSNDIALVMAGLPGTHAHLETFEKCTYMVRARRFFLSPLSVSETRQAVDSAFGKIEGLHVPAEVRESIVTFSSGHPYLIQLIGAEVFERALGAHAARGETVTVTNEMVEEAEEVAYAEYARNVLRLVFARVGEGTRAYLHAIIETMDGQGVMRSDRSIAEALGKRSYRSIANYRVRMIEAGVLRSVAKGKVKFRIPHIPRYLAEGLPEMVDDFWDADDDFPMS